MAQVSCQQPLCDEWFDSPCRYEGRYARAIEPDTKEIIPPADARRMSKILKRSVATAITALNNSEIEEPEAIITGTGMGCMENSEKFLVDLSRFGESCLKPTLFMQSTHNTISSLIAIILDCHAYNNTYSHKGISFESALLDAWLQMKAGAISSALVGSHDEVTPFISLVIEQTHPEYQFVSETSISAVLTSEALQGNLCEVADVKLLYRPDDDEVAAMLSEERDSLLLLGVNGNPLTDDPYQRVLDKLGYTPHTLQYKNIFGDNFSASAAAFYAAVRILERQTVPAEMRRDDETTPSGAITQITILNHSDDTAWSIIRLRKI